MTKAINKIIVVATIIAVICAGYTRRWITDDALIIIRTLEQIAAGNGPSFNATERVETNTSTLWQWYLYFAHVLTRQSFVSVMHVSCYIFAALAVLFAARASIHLLKATNKEHVLLVPFGILAFYASPGSRDFITSGLEWSLATAWLATCWYFSLAYINEQTHSKRILFLITIGLGWLVRPEFALYSVLLFAWFVCCYQFRSGRKVRSVLSDYFFALAIPVCYEIFRMGYYGNLVPQTAIVKTGTKIRVHDGLWYMVDFFYYYLPWLPLVFAAYALGIIFAIRYVVTRRMWNNKIGKQLLSLVVLYIMGALLQIAYVVRNGGDFMHARMLLLPFFVIFLPLAFFPVPINRVKQYAPVAAVMVVLSGVTVIAFVNGEEKYREMGWQRHWGYNLVAIERSYYTQGGTVQRLTARDYDGPVGQRPMDKEMQLCKENNWQCALIDVREHNKKNESSEKIYWRNPVTSEDDKFANLAPVLAVTNLGAISNDQPLNVVIHDRYGLCDPIAGRIGNIEKGRVGHSKQSNIALVVANSSVDINSLEPGDFKDQVVKYRQRLLTPEVQEFMATYREPMSSERFVKNIVWALTKSHSFKFDQNL